MIFNVTTRRMRVAVGMFTCAVLPILPAVEPLRARQATIQWEPYKYASSTGDTVAAELGRLKVREYRANPRSRLIELAFVRLPRLVGASATPVVYLDGGPGNSGISSSRGPRFAMMQALRSTGDVILMDHRGVGLSKPATNCSGNFGLSYTAPLTESETIAAAKRYSTACIAEMALRGIDLRGYTVKEAADDVDDLRRALGVHKINMLGLSYGTTQGLTVLRRHSAHVARAVLAGIEGPDDAVKLPSRVDSMFRAFDRLWQSDASHRAELSSLVGAYLAARDTLRKHPVAVRVLPWRAKDSVTVTVGPLDLELVTYQIMASDGLPLLPAFLARAAKGNFAPIAAISAAQRIDELNAMAWNVDCSTGASPQRRRQVGQETPSSLLGRAANLIYFPQVCSAWGNPDVGAEFRAPVRTTVPTLFIVGDMDARTPPIQAQLVRRTFTTSTLHIVEGAVHSSPLFFASSATLPAIVDFLKFGRMKSTHDRGVFSFFPASAEPLPR